ncbi:hypothetical protein LXL04_017142 [Taraxacum kok-saghyz]
MCRVLMLLSIFVEVELSEERAEDVTITTSQLRRSGRGGFTLRYIMMCLHDYVRVTSHYFASVALSVRGWVGAWPESSGRSGSAPVQRTSQKTTRSRGDLEVETLAATLPPCSTKRAYLK